jgi:hypothetical protein
LVLSLALLNRHERIGCLLGGGSPVDALEKKLECVLIPQKPGQGWTVRYGVSGITRNYLPNMAEAIGLYFGLRDDYKKFNK